MQPTLLILAAGMGSRYGGLKQVDPVGPGGETLMDYAVFDALRAGFGRVVFVIRRDFEEVFRSQVGARYAARVSVDYAFQSIDDLPAGHAVPEGRAKPWGTAHAIRAARAAVREPFAAINADDFYGADAFAQLAAFLAAPTARVAGRAAFAMAGYELRSTLSEHGTVARGVCTVGPGGWLEKVVEMTHLAAGPDGIANRAPGAAPVPLSPDTRVSMNCWGFTPELFGLLEARFPSWLDRHAGDPKAEWYIPFVVDSLLQEGRADVRVLPTSSPWFGMTYREDRPRTMAAIRALVASGAYPERLWA